MIFKQKRTATPGERQSSVYQTFIPRLVFERDNRDVRLVLCLLAEFYLTVNEGVESVIPTHSDVETRVVNSTSLTDDDVARLYSLISEFLKTESFAF